MTKRALLQITQTDIIKAANTSSIYSCPAALAFKRLIKDDSARDSFMYYICYEYKDFHGRTPKNLEDWMKNRDELKDKTKAQPFSCEIEIPEEALKH